MTRRRLTLGVLTAVVLVVVVAHPAGASSDLYGNVGPGDTISGLADRYPLGYYALDQHFSAVKASLTGGVDASGVPAMIAFFLANVTWQITAFAANAVIALFAFAFSLDLLNGSDATGGAGALAPVSEAIRGLYANTFGPPWMAIAVALAGCWAMWHALVQRRYTETAAALAMSLIYTVLALGIVTHPDQTIGQASRLSNELSTAFLSVGVGGEPAGGDQARRGAADQLFSLLIHTPWVALNFGGTEHCIRPGTGDRDHDPISLPVRPLSPDPATDTRLRRQLPTTGQITTTQKACVENTRRYSGHFLRYAPGSDDRDAEYQAVNDADPTQLPDTDPGKADGSYQPTALDKPVTDAMEKGGQDQRLLLSLVILAGELGALLLIGALSVSVLLSQVIVLLLACFAPVALVAAVVPGRGHHAFKAWAARFASYLVRKAAYSLVLAVILAVLSALQDATSNLGWLMSFGLQALLLWTAYLQRHALTAQLISTVTGHQPERDAQLRRLLGLRYASRVIAPVARRRPSGITRSSRDADHTTLPSDEHTGTTSPPIATVAPAAPDSVAQPAAEPVVDRERQPRRVPRDRPVPERDASATPSALTHHHGRHEDRAGTAGDRRARVAGAPDGQPAQPAASARALVDPRPDADQQSRRARRRHGHNPPPAPEPATTHTVAPDRPGPAPAPAEPPPAAPASSERSLAAELRADQPPPDGQPAADPADEPVPRTARRDRRTLQGPDMDDAR
jgi:hypothetical protein